MRPGGGSLLWPRQSPPDFQSLQSPHPPLLPEPAQKAEPDDHCRKSCHNDIRALPFSLLLRLHPSPWQTQTGNPPTQPDCLYDSSDKGHHRHKYMLPHPGLCEFRFCHQTFQIRKTRHLPVVSPSHDPAFSDGHCTWRSSPLHDGKSQMPCCSLPHLPFSGQCLHNNKAEEPALPQTPVSDGQTAVQCHCTSAGESQRSGCSARSADTAHKPLPERKSFRLRFHIRFRAHQTSDAKDHPLRYWSDGYPYLFSDRPSRQVSVHQRSLLPR